MGVMGRNLLSITDTEYDLAHGVIRFLFPNDDCAKANMAYWAGSSPVTEVELIDRVRGQDAGDPRTGQAKREHACCAVRHRRYHDAHDTGGQARRHR